MPKRKLIFAYLSLVGIPVLALLGILRRGQRLTPPVSVGGAWNLEADFSALAGAPCRDLLLSVKQPFLSISQSGPSLAFTINDSQRTTLTGTIQKTSLSMGPGPSGTADGGIGSCADPRVIHLVAEVGKEAEQRILTGTLSIVDCADCKPIPFRATRQHSREGEGR
jgi:hypothetical protein